MLNFFKKLNKGLNRLIYEPFFRTNKKEYPNFGYKEISSHKDYLVLKRKRFHKKILASYQKMVVVSNTDLKSKTIIIYPNFNCKYINFKIKFSKKNFPGLLPNSEILQCMFLPYLRYTTKNKYEKAVRLIIVTSRCQIFHNYPARKFDCDGEAEFLDIKRFEESVVWDLPNRKYPSLTPNENECEKYFPFLPKEAYEYHPILNTDSNYFDYYGNGGFGKTSKVKNNGKLEEVSRFYFPNRNNVQANSFYHIGGVETDYKISLLGTYRSNTEVGVRTCVFASNDGGRSWYCKYEFADSGEYDFIQGNASWGRNFGNNINTQNLEAKYKKNSLSIRKRELIYPDENEKDPKNLFFWKDKIEVLNIEKGEKTIIYTTKKHSLKTGNIVIIQENEEISRDWKLLCNNSITQYSGGNGTIYKVDVLDEYSFVIYECVSSAYNNISCRHIHHINRAKDGFIMGTGEIYPNGWIFFIPFKEADTFMPKLANDEWEFIRLNSTKNSVQRTMGVFLKDDFNSTLIFASDHDLLNRENIIMPEKREITFNRNSTGIFLGKLRDIDNLQKFKCIVEAREPSFFFKEINGIFIFSGQRGELILSFDQGKTWKKDHIDRELMCRFGYGSNYVIFDDIILVLK